MPDCRPSSIFGGFSARPLAPGFLFQQKTLRGAQVDLADDQQVVPG